MQPAVPIQDDESPPVKVQAGGAHVSAVSAAAATGAVYTQAPVQDEASPAAKTKRRYLQKREDFYDG